MSNIYEMTMVNVCMLKLWFDSSLSEVFLTPHIPPINNPFVVALLSALAKTIIFISIDCLEWILMLRRSQQNRSNILVDKSRNNGLFSKQVEMNKLFEWGNTLVTVLEYGRNWS